MTKCPLYRKTVKNVTIVLTEEAHHAFMAIADHSQKHSNYDTMDSALWSTVAHGTFIFCLDSHYVTSKVAKVVYTGGYGLLDEKAKNFTFHQIQTSHTFSLPFASGDLALFEELAKKGWGPKTELFLTMSWAAELTA